MSRGASAPWFRYEHHQDHARSRVQHALLANVRACQDRLSVTGIAEDNLIMECRAAIAAAMVHGDFGVAANLTDLMHEMIQQSVDSTSSWRDPAP